MFLEVSREGFVDENCHSNLSCGYSLLSLAENVLEKFTLQ